MRYFNTAGSCEPQLHYMVDIQDKLAEIKALVDKGAYFTVNRARQYGKTTTLAALAEYLERDYVVLTLDFQMIGNAKFENEYSFTKAFVKQLYGNVKNRIKPVEGLNAEELSEMKKLSENEDSFALDDLFVALSGICATAQKPVVLIIDEVDSATNNQVFIDFLAQLRAYYLHRRKFAAFQSVILAGVYDIKNIRRKIRPEEAHKTNSPWNIATDFKVNMSFSRDGIAGMLREYEADHHTGMNVEELSGLLYDYTSGYPFLVSKLCKLIDESVAGTEQFPKPEEAWTKEGFLEAVKLLLYEKNTLFESLMGKLTDYPEMAEMIYELLFSGSQILYNPDETWMDMAVMFGFIRNHSGTVKIANRIFEIRLYNYFLAAKEIPCGDRVLVEAVV